MDGSSEGVAGPMKVLKFIPVFLGLIYCWSLTAVTLHLITITR